MRVAKPQILNKEPAGLLTLNQRSPSHDSDPDPEVFGPGMILAWTELVKSGGARLPKPPDREIKQPQQHLARGPGPTMSRSWMSQPSPFALISSLLGMIFSCTINISSSMKG